jgi:hypothetical protein
MTTSESLHPSLLQLTSKRDELSKAIEAVEALLKVAGGTDFIESAIASIVKKSLGSISSPPSDTNGDDGEIVDTLTIREDQFFGMTLMDAVMAYLALVKKPKSAQDLIDAIKSGGYLFQTSKPLASITSTLNRSHHTGGPVVRTGKNTFALAEWYSGRQRTKKRQNHSSNQDDPIEDVGTLTNPDDLDANDLA